MDYNRIRYFGFDWDEGNYAKVQKHGLSIDTIESIFQQELLILADKKVLFHEKRYVAVRLVQGRGVFVVFTMRKEQIRVISARYMHKAEKEKYDSYQKEKAYLHK